MRVAIRCQRPTTVPGSRFEGLRFMKSQDLAAFLPHPLVQQTMHDQLSPNKADTEIVNSTRSGALFFCAGRDLSPLFGNSVY